MRASEIRLAVTAALVAAGSAQATDLVTFMRLMAERGAHAEANPLVRAALTDFGLIPLIAAKLALVAIVVAVFRYAAPHRASTALVVVAVATTAGLIGAFSNVLAL